MGDKDDDTIGSFYMNRQRGPQEPKRRLPPGLLTGVALLLLGAIIWYAYPRGAEKYTDVDVPVVKADASPIKEEPVDPGGMEVPHQDSTVFDPLENKPADIVEKLRPMPEEPVDMETLAKEGEPMPVPAVEKLDPQLNLEPQMKDEGNGVEKIITTEEPAPVAATPAKPPEAPAKKAAAPKPAAKGSSYIQLGSYREASAVKTDWEKLKKKYPTYLGDLSLKTVKVDIPGKGTYYRLHAGKMTEARAKEICSALKSLNSGGCILVK